MKKHLIIAGLCGLAMLPMHSSAQSKPKTVKSKTKKTSTTGSGTAQTTKTTGAGTTTNTNSSTTSTTNSSTTSTQQSSGSIIRPFGGGGNKPKPDNGGATTTPKASSTSYFTALINLLKEVGGNASALASADGAFTKNERMRIPPPPEAKILFDNMRNIGMESLSNDFSNSMNKAAEIACAQAKPIFIDAVEKMSIDDAKGIITGGNRSGTDFFKAKTKEPMRKVFMPIVVDALNKADATRYWDSMMDKFSKIPLVSGYVSVNLPEYVTDKTLDALYKLAGDEEERLRTNPGQAVNDVLKSVLNGLLK
jgi:hypothetical protein